MIIDVVWTVGTMFFVSHTTMIGAAQQSGATYNAAPSETLVDQESAQRGSKAFGRLLVPSSCPRGPCSAPRRTANSVA